VVWGEHSQAAEGSDYLFFADATAPLLLSPAAAVPHIASRRGSELPSVPTVEAARWEAWHSRWHGA